MSKASELLKILEVFGGHSAGFGSIYDKLKQFSPGEVIKGVKNFDGAIALKSGCVIKKDKNLTIYTISSSGSAGVVVLEPEDQKILKKLL